MALDLATILRNLRNGTDMTRVVTNPRAQFGTPTRRYIGAEILPERLVNENAYREETIKFRTIIANDGTRYSPVQLKGGALVGSFEVFLAESDIGSEMTSAEYDALINYLRRNATMDAVAQILRFIDVTINIPLIELNEKHRWEAILNAQVLLAGDNKYAESVAYSDPAGHRANAAAAWSNNATDPFVDIHAMIDLFRDKGLTCRRIITSWANVGILSRNAEVKKRGGITTLDTSGQLQSVAGRMTLQRINEVLQEDGLPPIETYDLRYRTQTGTARFMAEDTMTLIADTGREETLDLGDGQEEILPDVLGYVGVGRPAGRSVPGRTTHVVAKEDKPPRIEAQGWQTSLPVITEPEAVCVIKNIS